MNPLEQWLHAQAEHGRRIYLVLDADGQLEERNALIAMLDSDQYRNLYVGTLAASLADMAPYLIQLESTEHPALQTLLHTPGRNWGWLGSAETGDLETLTRHWQDRLISGERPNQALYRIHDNRVLGRALAFLLPEQRPDFLGPLSSVCYWHADQWQSANNPAPGMYPLPPDPAWSKTPIPEATFTGQQFDNTRRYLVREHSERLIKLVEQYDLDTWLRQQLELARTWQWREPEQIHFLLTQSLQASSYALPKAWLPKPDETPSMHFDRLYQEALYWQGDAPL